MPSSISFKNLQKKKQGQHTAFQAVTYKKEGRVIKPQARSLGVTESDLNTQTNHRKALNWILIFTMFDNWKVCFISEK